MPKKYIDLHIHSSYSDGLLTPAEIVIKAKKRGVQLIALTDHDTTDGVMEFLNTARREGLPAIYGAEFSCQMNGRDLHILGYNISLNDHRIQKIIANFKELLQIFTRQRLKNFEKNFGVKVDISELPADGNMTSIRLAYWLLSTGKIKPEQFPRKIKDLIQLFKHEDIPLLNFLPHLPLAEDVVEIICKANGFPVLAHPESMDITFSEVLKLYSRGLKGIEAFYPGQNPEPYLKWALKLNLAVTAGTDYHGVLDRNERLIGYYLPENLPENLYIYTGDISL